MCKKEKIIKEKLLKTIFFLIWTLKALESLVPYRHVDALNYHMVVGKYLSLGLFEELWRSVPGALMSGIFDLLYIIPNLAFGYGLKAHVFSQFLHFFFSLGLASLTLFYYFSKKKRTLLGLVSGISILTISKGSSFFLYAKNDGVLALVFLLTIIYFYENFIIHSRYNSKSSIVLGILLGLSPAIKLNGLIYIIPVALYFVYLSRKNIRNITLCSGSAFIIWMPFLIRNYYYMGNPFFPGLMGFLHGNASKPMIDFYTQAMSAQITMHSLVDNIKNLLLAKIVFLYLLLLLIIYKKYAREILLGIFIIVGFFLAMLVNGGVSPARFIFPLVFLLIFYLSTSLKNVKLSKFHFVFIIILLLVDSKIDKSISRIYGFSKDFVDMDKRSIMSKYIPKASLWDFISISNNQNMILMLTDEWSQQYYAPSYLRIIQLQHNPDASFMVDSNYNCETRIQKYDYILLKNPSSFTCITYIEKIWKKRKYMGYTLYEN